MQAGVKMCRNRLLREPRTRHCRHEVQCISVIQLTQNDIRKGQSIQLPERVIVAVVVEILVGRLEGAPEIREFMEKDSTSHVWLQPGHVRSVRLYPDHVTTYAVSGFSRTVEAEKCRSRPISRILSAFARPRLSARPGFGETTIPLGS